MALKEKDIRHILKTINSISKRKEELWLCRVVPFDKGRKEKWIISLVNRKRKATEKDLTRSLRAVSKLDRNAEYWVCGRVKKGKWLCTFYPKGGEKGWNV